MQVKRSRWTLLLVVASIGIAGCGESLEEKVTSAVEREQQRQLESKGESAGPDGHSFNSEAPAPGREPADRVPPPGSSSGGGGDSASQRSMAPLLRVGDAKVHVDR